MTDDERLTELERVLEQDTELRERLLRWLTRQHSTEVLEALAQPITAPDAAQHLVTARNSLRAYALQNGDTLPLQLFGDEVDDVLRRFVAETA